MLTRSRARSRKQIYLGRLKSSPCRGQTSKCREKYGCKKTRKGRRRSYCRKSRNTHA